jgi:hypothetical protein
MEDYWGVMYLAPPCALGWRGASNQRRVFGRGFFVGTKSESFVLIWIVSLWGELAECE